MKSYPNNKAELLEQISQLIQDSGDANVEWFHQVSIVLYLTTLDLGQLAETYYIVGFDHDMVEDKDYPLNSIEGMFGATIARSTALISKVVPGGTEKSTADYYDAIGDDAFASIVKGADRIHNFQSMPGVFPPEKQARYIAEAREFILPMLKKARNKFPRQRAAYENIKHVLLMQMTLISNTLEGKK